MAKSKLTNCKVCGAEVAKNAKVCPSCGAKIKKVNPFLIGIIVLAVIIIIASASKNDEPKLVENENLNTPSTVEQTKNAKTEFFVGETAELKNICVSMVDVWESEGSAFNEPTDGNVFVLCEFEIVNNSDEEMTVSSMLSFEAYCDDYTCAFSLGALLEKGNKNQLDGTVAPSKKLNGVIGYEVPADWKELELHFTPNVWSEKDITFIATK